MNGPTRMYQLRRIINHEITIQLPDCMYPLKNISTKKASLEEPSSLSPPPPPSRQQTVDISDQNCEQLPEMTALEVRQEEILQQLAELKEQMKKIRAQLGVGGDKVGAAAPARSSVVGTALKINNAELQEIVINASPENPPYSLEILQKLLAKSLCLSVTCHLHSTLTKLDERTATFARQLENFSCQNGSSTLPRINLRLIWKNVGPELELYLNGNVPIIGEINLLRYLARLNLADLAYEENQQQQQQQVDPNEIDSILDLSFQLLKAKTKTARSTLLQTLNKSLEKNQWLGGGSKRMTIADIANYSAIRQVFQTNEVGATVTKWLARCSNC